MVSDYIDVEDRTKSLGCIIPQTATLLPENFETAATRSEFRFCGETVTCGKVLALSDFPIERLIPNDERHRSVTNKSIDLFLPTIFFSFQLLSSYPDAVSVALNILSSYLYDRFKGTNKGDAQISVVIETDSLKTTKKVTYIGPVEGLITVAAVCAELQDGR